MKHYLSGKWTLLVLLLATPLMWGQGAHRIGQVIVRGNNVAANIGPFAKILVCAPNTFCNTTATIYSDQALTHVLVQPVTADASGNYGYYISAGCVDEKISLPGLGETTVTNVCPFSGSGGGESGFPIIFGSTSIGAGSTTTSVSGLTVNGVTPTTFGFLDPTSSVQTQLNSKAHTFTLTTTGSSGAATYSGDVLNIPQYAGGGMVYPAAGVAVSTGSAWTTSKPLAGAGAGVVTGPNSGVTPGDLALFTGTGGQITDGAIAGSNVVQLTATQTLTNKTIDGATPAEVAFLSGVTSAIQTQLNAKVTHSTGSLVATFVMLGNGSADSKTSGALSDNGTTVTSTEPVAVASSGASSITLTGTGPNYTQITVNLFSTLPTCNSGAEGTIAPVSDSSTNTWGATVTGGSTNHVLAYCDGTNWTVAAK